MDPFGLGDVVNISTCHSGGKSRKVVQARSMLCYWAVRELHISMTELARRLNLSITAVSNSAARGRKPRQNCGLCLVGSVMKLQMFRTSPKSLHRGFTVVYNPLLNIPNPDSAWMGTFAGRSMSQCRMRLEDKERFCYVYLEKGGYRNGSNPDIQSRGKGW
jgi:hypothetical protein